MFDREIRGQLAMLMGGRAAEEVSCDSGGCCAAVPVVPAVRGLRAVCMLSAAAVSWHAGGAVPVVPAAQGLRAACMLSAAEEVHWHAEVGAELSRHLV